MQPKILCLSFFAALAAAASSNSTSLSSLVAQLPECADSCFASAASSAGCASTNFTCLCGSKKSAFISDITPCLALSSGCSSSQLSNIESLATQICEKVNDNPSSADVAAASSIVASAVGTAAASSSAAAATTATGNAALRPEAGFGLLGALAFAAFAY